MIGKNKKSKLLRKLGLRHLVILAVLIFAGLAWYWHRAPEPASNILPANTATNIPKTTSSNSAASPNTAPPAKNPTESTNGGGAATPTQKTASILISQPAQSSVSSSFTVRASVAGVAENGGTCTATLTSGSKTHSFSSTGFLNASSTTCSPISVSGLTKGTWTLVVSYSSSTTSARSASQTLEVN